MVTKMHYGGSLGLLPIIQHMKCGGRALDTLEEINTVKDFLKGKGWIEVSVDGMCPSYCFCLHAVLSSMKQLPPSSEKSRRNDLF